MVHGRWYPTVNVSAMAGDDISGLFESGGGETNTAVEIYTVGAG